jgi:hypothetical protein
MSKRHLSLLPLVLLLACDPPDVVDDAGTDAGPTACEAPPPAIETGGEGHAAPLGSSATEARAGRLTEAMLPVSSTGLETWAAGDFVLANDRVALIIEDDGPSDLYDRYGGRPVGLSLVDGGAMVQPADFNEVLFGISTFLVQTENVTVMNDGSDGGSAVIRATGPLGAIDFAGSLLDAVTGGNFMGESAAVDYSLAPGAEAIEVSLVVSNPEPRMRVATRMLIGFFQSYRMPMFLPGTGFADASGVLPFVAFDDEYRGAGWAWYAQPDRDVNAILTTSGVGVASLGSGRLMPCDTTSISIGRIVIGDGLSGTLAAIARIEETPLRTLTGTVTEADGTTAANDVRIHVEVDGTYYTRRRVEDDGTYSIEIPAAGAARIQAYRRGFDLTSADVPAGADPVTDVSMPAFGEIHVVATEDDAPVPARVQVLPSSGAPPRPPVTYAEREVTGGRLHVEFPTDGDATVRVPAGSYRVIVSRGYEYELVDQTVTVTAGAISDVTAALVRSVDTTDVLCADYHIHTTRSPDSPDSATLKMSSLVADGLEIAVRSDHEFINDFQPVVDELGVAAFVRGLAGEELTTFEWGHFGVFPATFDPAAPNGSATPWVGRRPPEVFAEVRARPESPAFIVNHPRSTSVAQGYFEVVGFDAVTGEITNESDWDETFDILEAFNDSSFNQNRGSTVRDWFAFLNQRRPMVVVGSSDSHSLYSSPIGYPRTCLALGTDDPMGLSPTLVRDETRAGHSVISGGIYMTVEHTGGAGPGDTVSGAGATAMVHVVVRAAEWVDVDTLEVIVDGATTETIALSRDAVDPTLLLDEDVAVPVAASAMGSWAVFHASGDEDMADLHPGREPFAVSNAMFFTR